jgi:hypothetical protein
VELSPAVSIADEFLASREIDPRISSEPRFGLL